MRLKAGTEGDGYVAVLAAATAQDGFLHYVSTFKKGIRKEDVVHFLKVLKSRTPNHDIAVFLDNASCFTARDTKAAACEMGIALIYNMPYMPQFNGMENVWRHVKAAYR